ncbi:MAG: carboxypeptidase-like regulatory domain-containing protein, partial [Thermoplasmatota archaeon]
SYSGITGFMVAATQPTHMRAATVSGLIDDIYRPIAGGLILIQGIGLTATTDDLGQFTFVDLLPASYILLATAPNHEASPVTVDVLAGEYAEPEIAARRIFSDNGATITTQYSVFIPCASAAGYRSVDYGGVLCPADVANSDYRPGLSDLKFGGEGNVTFLVAEIKTNQKDNYVFVLRHDDGSTGGAERWGSARINNTDYGRVVLEKGKVYQSWQTENAIWKNENKTPMAALLFFIGQGSDQTGPVLCQDPVPADERVCGGFGHRFAIKANIILTLFIGAPQVDVSTYHVLSASA